MKPSDGHKQAAFVIPRKPSQQLDPACITWAMLSTLLLSLQWNKVPNRLTPIVFVQSR